ncbi:hypothetical protein [Streptomyces sp. NPDC046751]
MQVALTTLLRRIPGLRLRSGPAMPPSEFKLNDIVFGLRSMPVVW